MALTRQDIQKLAQLARLAQNPQEEEDTLKSLNAVLGLIDELKNADVDNVDPMAYVQLHGQTLRTRAATAVAGYPPEQLMQNAPQADENHFLVPKVIE